MKKKHPKPKDGPPASGGEASKSRGRGTAESRGRGRGGADRGSTRGGRGAKTATHTNGTKPANTSDGWDATPAQQSTDTTGAWDTVPENGDASAAAGDWANDPGKDALASLQTEEPKPAASAAPSTAKPGGWAGLFAKPPPAPKKAPAPVLPPPPAIHQVEQPPTEPVPAIQDTPPAEIDIPPPIESVVVDDGPSELPSAPHSDTGKDLTPSKDELTEKNLEKLPDTSHPPPSATAASTVASTQDPLAAAEATKPIIRPGMSGFAATALKATGTSGRSASYTRKVMEQHEAVVMPGNHAIEKTAVQFGKLGLGADDVDVDEDREEPETRTQLPDDSPSAPRASLPPSLPETQPQPGTAAPSQPLGEVQQSQRAAPGLPPAPQQAQQPSPQSASAYADQYRYGQGQKPYDPFSQQGSGTQGQSQSQEPFSNQVPNQTATTSAQNDYSAYYGRDAYNYYGAYAHDAQRTGGGFGTSAPDTQGQYATSRPQPQSAGGQQDAQGSGDNTPAPGQPAQQHSNHLQQNQGHGYPYGYPNAAYNQQYPQYSASYINQMNHRYGANRPMFDDVRRQDSDYYGSQQYNYGHGQNHYGGYNKYGQPQAYSYEHSSSPANAGTFGRDGGYGRAGSAQPSEAQQTAATSTAFGSTTADPFGRTSSGFGQGQGLQQHSSHQGSDDPSKVSGPSPSLQGGRPSSAVNSLPGQQSGLPPPSQHSNQQAFGGYPQYGGLGNVSGHQSGHQNTAAYGAGYGGSNSAFGAYGGYGGGRGWNGSYGSGH